jgi:hypothetical protein
MTSKPTYVSIAKELMLSRWLFAIFTILSGVASAAAFYALGERVAAGWMVATCVGALAWALVGHFGKQLSVVAAAQADEFER